MIPAQPVGFKDFKACFPAPKINTRLFRHDKPKLVRPQKELDLRE